MTDYAEQLEREREERIARYADERELAQRAAAKEERERVAFSHRILRAAEEDRVRISGLDQHGISLDLRRKRHAGRTKAIEEGHCRLCQRPVSERPSVDPASVRELTRHHLVPRRWFRPRPHLAARYRDVDANIVPLCRPCHDDVETDLGARRMLRHALSQAEIAFCIQIRGKQWLDNRYPLRSLSGYR